jgi:type II secretory pathway component PulF
MPLIVTPGQLKQRSELYYQLASLTAAGIPLIRGFEMVRDSRAARSFRRPLNLLIGRLNQGSTFGEALLATGDWLPSFDIALIQAAEKSGRLDSAFRSLSDYYSERAALVRSFLWGLAYPLAVVHLALIVFPTNLLAPLVWEGKAAPFLWQKITVFGPLYGAILLIAYACQGRHGEWWRSWVERFALAIPILGSARRHLALARLSAALEGLLNAGVSVVEAWEMAAMSSGSPALRRAVLAWRPSLEAGETPAEMVQDTKVFPELFASLYNTGELSGQLDDTLRRLYNHYQEEGSRKLREFARWSPRIIYFGLTLMIAYQIVSFWVSYYSGIMSSFSDAVP